MTKKEGRAHSPITTLSLRKVSTLFLFVCLYGRLVFEVVSPVAQTSLNSCVTLPSYEC